MPDVFFQPIDVNRTPNEIADEVSKSWKDKDILKKALTTSLGNRRFIFLEGPPTANGRPHVGHSMTRTMKDAILRYRYMTGHKIERRVAGWDCHGLPVEIEAEKHFGFKTKKEIEEFGIAKFNEYCRESIFRYIDEWMEADRRIGLWIDHEKAYVTLRNEFIESEWWALKNLNERSLLVKDYKIVPYCPRCETSLSSHEVSQGYDDVKDPSVYVKFKAVGQENTYFLAWTTTPWTLPSNQFLAVNPDYWYVLAELDGARYYVAEDLASQVLGNDYKIVKRLRGKELEGMKYDQLLKYIPVPPGCLTVVTGNHVHLEEGTGIVHTSPAFGVDDFEIGKRMGVKIINPINASGHFDDERLPFRGKFFKDADAEILAQLKKDGSLFRSERKVHTYPFCYRCGTPLLYYPLLGWFIKVSEFREQLLANNEKVNWMPDHLKDGRFGNFLQEAKDWALSRNRFWGTPLPIWSCPDGHTRAVGSREELRALAGDIPEDLHRPFIDQVKFKCDYCGKDMTREPYVIDTWFDSGSATYAAQHYPFEKRFNPNSDLPITYITEAIDQTRGWFYTLHVVSSLLFGKNAYANVLSIDHILDEQGRKMSKSKGNSVYALDFINQFGPDPVRMFFMSGAPWKSKAIDRKLIVDLSRKVLGTMANVYSFFASNANLDSFRPGNVIKPTGILDRWILSRVNSTLESYIEAMDNYRLDEALRLVQDLIDETSNFYLRLSRRRFWSDDPNKLEAYQCLYLAIDRILRMLAPLTPFFSEYLFLKLHPDAESVHLEHMPKPDHRFIDRETEGYVKYAISIIELTRRLRQEASIKGRQPVTEVLIHGSADLPQELLDAVSPEINARSIKFIRDDQRPVVRIPSLIIEKAAPVLKSKLKAAQEFLQMEPGLVLDHIDRNEMIKLQGIELDPSMISVKEEPLEGYISATDGRLGLTVFLNKVLDRDLLIQGTARDLLRRIQVMRKESSLDYDEYVDLAISP
ncbi:MAG TPA: isoleucine--tRNA ligase, partial [Thermoplasmataceae archaeon]|nr:isoleucine--tRNA ligase [Thermoplasmataceae archaeon]